MLQKEKDKPALKPRIVEHDNEGLARRPQYVRSEYERYDIVSSDQIHLLEASEEGINKAKTYPDYKGSSW